MKNKDFREIQVSSSLLVVIFLGVLALGVFIFLLGVSVGKKQVRISAPTQVVAQQIPEPVNEPPLKPAAADTETSARPTPSQSVPKTAVETKKAAPAATGVLYYVQVAAFTDRAQARALADRFGDQGYTAVVADPKPTDAKTWYRVRLGGYPSRERAVALLDKLNAAAGKKTDYRVVQD